MRTYCIAQGTVFNFSFITYEIFCLCHFSFFSPPYTFTTVLQCVYFYFFFKFYCNIVGFPLFQISFPFRSPQSIEQSSLCYTVGSHQLSTLYIVSIVYICQSPSPSSSHPRHWNFDRDCIESIGGFRQYGHFNNVNSLDP